MPGSIKYLRKKFHTTNTGARAGVPDAPTIGTASAGNAQASVAFTAPANTGGYPITQYMAANFTDPYFNNVSILMHMEGANQGKVFTDVKGHTVNAYGSANTATTLSKFGNSSAYFSTGSAGYLSVAGDSSTDFGLGDFTIEFWLLPDSFAMYPATRQLINKATTINTDGTGTNLSWRLGQWSGGPTQHYLNIQLATSPTFWALSSDIDISALNTSTWTHIALVRQSGVLKVFANGILKDSYPFNSYIPDVTTAPIWVGANPDGSESYKGFLDELRITKGVARYTANFTVPIASFPDALIPANSATGASSPITITGLTNGSSYSFAVKAMNALGYGAYSALSNSVTPDAPKAWSTMANNLIDARIAAAGFGTITAAIAAGGSNSSGFLATSEIFNGTTWASTGAIPAQTGNFTGCGSTSSGITVGGYQNAGYITNATYGFNGTSWSSKGNMTLLCWGRAAAGTGTSAIASGGYNNTTPNVYAACEQFNGTSWSAGGTMVVANNGHCTAGTKSNALVAGYYNYSQAQKFNGISWSSIGSGTMPTSQWSSLVGDPSSAFCYARGQNESAITSIFNGTTWAVSDVMPVTKQGCATSGVVGAALAPAGYSGGYLATVHKYS